MAINRTSFEKVSTWFYDFDNNDFLLSNMNLIKTQVCDDALPMHSTTALKSTVAVAGLTVS